MKIHEYQAKGVLRRFGVPLLPGRSATTPDEAVAAAAIVSWFKSPPWSKAGRAQSQAEAPQPTSAQVAVAKAN